MEPALPVRPTVNQTAEYLNCSPTHVRRLITEGKLEASRIGKRAIRLSRASVLALVGAA
ncbi:helix-turn-helix domain-containing protein [Mycolicibacterium moriokaense]|nr:helix-turn-helix domain-containing protein [Mycolicibacterium moriokaense]